jgi:hypothetical protein
MQIPIQVGPPAPETAPVPVDYRWDAATSILSARIGAGQGGGSMVAVEGRDGSWLTLDVAGGALAGIEVAVWPRVRHLGQVAPPPDIRDAAISVGGDADGFGHASTPITVDADPGERTFHFRLAPATPTRTLRIARDVLIDVDHRSRLAGLWLLNVPPCPCPP